MPIKDTARKLGSRLTRKLPPQPEPTFEYREWTPPDPATKPNEADARREGARALANVQPPPPPPQYGQHVT